MFYLTISHVDAGPMPSVAQRSVKPCSMDELRYWARLMIKMNEHTEWRMSLSVLLDKENKHGNKT